MNIDLYCQTTVVRSYTDKKKWFMVPVGPSSLRLNIKVLEVIQKLCILLTKKKIQQKSSEDCSHERLCIVHVENDQSYLMQHI